jgi:hypothetical protein
MVWNDISLDGTVEEYGAIIAGHIRGNMQPSSLDWSTIVEKLESEHGWTH